MSGVQALLIGSGALTGLGAFLLLRAALVVDQPHLVDAWPAWTGVPPSPSRPVRRRGTGGLERQAAPRRGPQPSCPPPCYGHRRRRWQS